jgi:hypothetical protein
LTGRDPVKWPAKLQKIFNPRKY